MSASFKIKAHKIRAFIYLQGRIIVLVAHWSCPQKSLYPHLGGFHNNTSSSNGLLKYFSCSYKCLHLTSDCRCFTVFAFCSQGHENIYDDPYQPEMDAQQPASSGARRRAYYRNRDHFATIRTASLVCPGKWLSMCTILMRLSVYWGKRQCVTVLDG